ncbi:MAG: glycosyltransferase [Opitutales bacterium]
MRVLLTSHGSTGDIYPVIRLGRALVDAGHEVKFATVTLFKEEIEAAGVEYVYLPPDWDQSGFAEAMRDLAQVKDNLQLLKSIYGEAVPYLQEIITNLTEHMPWCDLMVSSYVFSPLKSLADKFHKPFATQLFVHDFIPSRRVTPHPIWGLRGWPRGVQDAWNAMWWRIIDRVLVSAIHEVLGTELKAAGLKLPESFLQHPANLSLVTLSGDLFRPEFEEHPDQFQYSGYLRWQAKEDPELDKEVEAFTEGEPVPILTFGSVTFEKQRRVMSRFMKHWPKGKKIIVQEGWAGLTVARPRPEIKVVGKVSHDQLFKHASVIIHHGGSGTTGTAFHAGKPQIVIPHFGDQYFFGDEVERLGCGYHLKRRRWPENLPSVIRKIHRHTRFADRAKEVADILAKEDGPGNAAKILEKYAEEEQERIDEAVGEER